MEPLFQFIGGYWWLVFPLMGVMGGVGSAWERNARRRHKRRIELLHAKSELKAAQAAARGKALPAAAAPRATRAPDPFETDKTYLERLFAAQDAVTKRWLDYELDVAKIIAYPAMSDGRQPLTAAFLRAKKVADGLRPASSGTRLNQQQLADYRNAVTDYELAFDVAERDAKRLKDSSFSDFERKRLDTAKQLLTIAIDQAATPAERQLAYKRVREELDGLISLSDGAIDVLEQKVALEISAGPAPAAATPAPDVRPAGAPAREPKAAPWPVPARGATSTPPGRVTRPKPRP
jgi:hypothetical protein